MIATITTVIINTILDPIFHLSIPLGYSGSRHCHHSGSNHRTGVAIQNLHKQERIAPSPPRHFTNCAVQIDQKNTIAIGMSPFLMNLAACFIVKFFINKGLKEYDAICIAHCM